MKLWKCLLCILMRMNNGYFIHYLYQYSEFSFAWNTQFVMVMEMRCFSASLEEDCYAFKVFIFSKIRLRFSNWKIIYKGFCLTSEDSIGGGSSTDEGKDFFFWVNFHNILSRETSLPLSQDSAYSFLSLSSLGVCLCILLTYNKAKIVLIQPGHL